VRTTNGLGGYFWLFLYIYTTSYIRGVQRKGGEAPKVGRLVTEFLVPERGSFRCSLRFFSATKTFFYLTYDSRNHAPFPSGRIERYERSIHHVKR